MTSQLTGQPKYDGRFWTSVFKKRFFKLVNIEMDKLRQELKKRNVFIAEMNIDQPINVVLKKYNEIRKHKDELDFSYRLFLYCCTLQQARNLELRGPGRIIDEVWHSHILHSERYHYHCNKIFGSYLHHTPGRNASGKKESYFDLSSSIKLLGVQDEKWMKHAIPIVNIFADPDLIKP